MTASDDRPMETAQQWLHYAEGDLAVAEHEMQRPSPVYHTVCFLCQSAAEKFLKGFLFPHCRDRKKAMDESIIAETKKQKSQKPPLSVGRIVGEILAGLALGFVPLLVVYVIGSKLAVGPYGLINQDDALFFLMIFNAVFLWSYGFGSAVGVYLVGSRGSQTGSFLLSLAGGFVGAWGVFLPSFILFTSGKVILYLPLSLLLLIPPGMATLGFNLLRRYKKPPSP